MAVSKVCEHCKTKFAVPNRRHESVKFCSRECKTAAGWLDLTCVTCGDAFKRKRSDQKRTALPYCSRDCYLKAMPGMPRKREPDYFKTCEHCGDGYKVVKSRLDISRYCSKECQVASPTWRARSSEVQQGERHWRWAGGNYETGKGYIRHKRKVLGQEAFTFNHRHVVLQAMLNECPDHPFIVTVDGKKALNREIDVHHIDRQRANNELSNLLAVTKDAHAQIHHRGKKPEPWECWPSNPVKW